MGDYFVDKEEAQDILALTSDRVKENVELFDANALGQTVVYHIAMERRPMLVPAISKRAGKTEDNTLPRVCVAADLRGCWLGYSGIATTSSTNRIHTTKQEIAKDKASVSIYKGGFYIHEIGFRIGLKPNKELVYDCENTKELWLFAYNQYTSKFPTRIIGSFFTVGVHYYPRAGEMPDQSSQICLCVEPGQQVRLDNSDAENNFLFEGYYLLSIDEPNKFRDFKVTVEKTLTEEEFQNLKLKTAATLSY
jgi:hypothetical protein